MNTYRTLRTHPMLPAIATITIIVALAAAPRPAAATEIIPSIGITSPVHDASHLTKTSIGLALRGNMGPLKPEIAAGYRSESRFDGALQQRMWPVTASLWVAPVPMIYAGAGAGWYHTTLDYDPVKAPGLKDTTHEDFGVHVGGGMKIPLVPLAALDLQGRYVMMRPQDSHLVPEKFKADFWTLSAGVAVSF